MEDHDVEPSVAAAPRGQGRELRPIYAVPAAGRAERDHRVIQLLADDRAAFEARAADSTMPGRGGR